MAERCKEAHDVGGAAGDPMPGRALIVATALQRVHVEVVGAVEGTTTEEAVVQHSLQLVGKPRLACNKQHAPTPHEEPYGRASFTVAAVAGQLIRIAKALALEP